MRSSRHAWIVKRGTLRFGMTRDYLPFTYLDKTTQKFRAHPDQPFDFAEKAYWLQRDAAWKDFVDQWLHIAMADGSFQKLYAAGFE